MNQTKMIKTVKKQSIYDTSSTESSKHSYTKGTIQTSGRIRRRTILGEKFDYGEKIKEKQNYVLYVAGQGQEKKEIEEIEELPTDGKKERIVEQKQIIDNYQYHETKDIKKKHSRNSQTQHKRLCDPFERTMVKKYSSYTSEPRKGGYKIIRTTNIVDKNDYSKDFFLNNKNGIKSHLNSYTVKTQRSPNSNRFENCSNMSNSSSTNDSCKITNRSTNISQINRNRRPISSGGRINNFSQYERKKVNGIEKAENYNITYDQKKQNLLPQNTIKYKYDKDTEKISSANNNTCNRIPINISKYSKPNNRLNSPLNRIQNNHVIKLDSQIKQTKEKEKSLYEGPKYQLIGKDLPKDKPRPKTVSHSRTRSNRVRNHQIKQSSALEKKGYIPFGGKGYKVGGAPVHIPKPNNNRSRIPKPNEDRNSSIRVERNTSYTETSQRNSGNISSNFNNYSTLNNTSNIRGLKNLHKSNSGTNNNKPKIRHNINTKNYQRPSQYDKKIEKNDNKFPGKGIRVGSSGINKSELISEMNNNISYAEYKKFEQDNMDILEISGKKNEIVKCFEQSLYFQGEQNGIEKRSEKRFEESLCFRSENEEIFKEIFCPVHGRQLIRISDFNN
jgi:uncharacterized protein (UPF0297 family)